jgi:hypothetical protein
VSDGTLIAQRESYPVRVSVPNPKRVPRPNLFVRVVVLSYQNPNAIRIAQQELQGLKTVHMVTANGTVPPRQIAAALCGCHLRTCARFARWLRAERTAQCGVSLKHDTVSCRCWRTITLTFAYCGIFSHRAHSLPLKAPQRVDKVDTSFAKTHVGNVPAQSFFQDARN